MIRLIQQGGFFYLSTPIGRECVEFNANWFFDPRKIVGIAQDSGLTLTKLTVLASGNGPEESAFDDVTLSDLAAQEYSLGIFVFVKTMDTKSRLQSEL